MWLTIQYGVARIKLFITRLLNQIVKRVDDEGSYHRRGSTIWSSIVSSTEETAPAEGTLQR